jgi:hypothetical protein
VGTTTRRIERRNYPVYERLANQAKQHQLHARRVAGSARRWYVESYSERERIHPVTIDCSGGQLLAACDCDGFRYVGHCQHIAAALQTAQLGPIKPRGIGGAVDGFTGVYDADGHRADVIALLQGGKPSYQLLALHNGRVQTAFRLDGANDKPFGVLPRTSVLEIYRRAWQREPHGYIALDFGISFHQVSKIKCGRNYRYFTGHRRNTTNRESSR